MPGGDPYRQRTRGQPLEINSVAWNKMLEETRARDVKGATGDSVALPRDTTRVKVRNDSGVAVAQFGVLGLASGSGPLIAPPGNLNEFQRQPALSGVKPAAGDAGLFCVLLEPFQPGAIGWAAVSGVVPVQVTGAAQIGADVLAGDTTQLTMSATGSAQVLWADTGAGTRWALARLLGPPGAGGVTSPVNGMSNMNASVFWTSDNAWHSLGSTMTVTLPGAGTYLVTANVSFTLTTTSGVSDNNDSLAAGLRFYNDTAGAPATQWNSAPTTLLSSNAVLSVPIRNHLVVMYYGGSIGILLTVAGSTTLHVEVLVTTGLNTVQVWANNTSGAGSSYTPCNVLYTKIG